MMGSIAFAQTSTSDRYFPETGHWVSGDFLVKYEGVPDSAEIYGFPITSAYIDQDSGLRVQYFENARFELHPDEGPDTRIKITPLGEFLYTPDTGEKVSIPENFPACQLFPEISFSVCYAFLDYFQENGGVSQFGYPISGFEIHDGWMSQYFQRARFEWHPELPAGERVVLTNLGTRYFYFHREDPKYLQPQLDDNIAQQRPTSLQVYAFVSHPVLPINETEQELFVIVYDQNFKPVEGVYVSYKIIQPDEVEEGILVTIGHTDKNGISTKSMNLPSLSAGTIEVEVSVMLNTIIQQTITSFQVW